MSLFSAIGNLFKKKETVTIKEIAPKTLPSVTVVDVGTRTQERTGGITVVGAGGLVTNRGGRGGATSQGTITKIEGNVSAQQAEQITGAKAAPVLERVRVQQPGVVSQQQQQVIASATAPNQIQRIKESEIAEGRSRFVGTTYYQEGKQLGGVYKTPEGKQYAVTKKPGAVVTVREGNVEKVVTFKEEGAEVQTRTYAQPKSVSPTIQKSFGGKVIDLFFNPARAVVFPEIKYKGKSVSPQITLTDVKQAYANEIFPTILKPSFNLPFLKEPRGVTEFKSKVFAEFIPTTYGGSIIFVAAPGIYTKLPTAARIVASSYIAYEGVKGAADVSSPPETRVASGIVGGLGTFGAITEALPFVRGIRSRISSKYKPVEVAEQGFKEIKVSEINTKIGLIPPGYPSKTGATSVVELPGKSPLVQGGFHRVPGGENIFIGEEQQLGTSQRGFFNEGAEIPIAREFFVTPQEPYLKIAETRISRLGLDTFFEIPKKKTKLGFGFPEQPQIGIVQANVGRTESRTTFALGKGTELEAIKTFGTITSIKKIGTTAIQGQGVDIYSFNIGGRGKSSIKNIYSGITTESTSRISGEGFLATTNIPRRRTIKTSTPSSQTIFASLNIPSVKIVTSRATKSSGSFSGVSIKTTNILSPPISPPKSPPRTPPVSPPIFPTKITPPFTPRRSPQIIPPRTPPKRISIGRPAPRLFGGLFNVFVRRQGKFRQVGGRLSLGGAFNLGEITTQKGLSQTFKVRSATGGATPFRLPKGFYAKQSRKEGIVFIEKSKSKINTPSEKFLLNIARRKR